MLSILAPYKNLILQSSLSVIVPLIATLLRLPTRFLLGLHTYIHPENLASDNKPQSGVRAAIRRPEPSDPGLNGYQNLGSNGDSIRKRSRVRDKFEFDENNAQIFRLVIVDSHIESRVYFREYRDAFVYTAMGLSSLVLCNCLLVGSESDGVLVNGSVVPFLLGFVAVFKVGFCVGKASFERSASRRLEKQTSVVLGVLGFVFAVAIVFLDAPVVFDFDLDGIDGFGKFLLCVFAGCIAGFMFIPANKNARAFWLGTDQLRWDLSIISCGLVARVILYVNFLVFIFTALLWINPVSDIFVMKRNSNPNVVNWGKGLFTFNENLVEKIGFVQSEFRKLRIWFLLASGILQFAAIRPNLQMYLNEAVLSWYQRLHSGKVPDLDFSRAKIFLHNHHLCLVVLQFFAPSALILSFVELSQIEGEGEVAFMLH
ncbi:hypothetical protein Syun_012874 [Stephania yunnanensis]|uniref:Uncharacterized protein n=1 Tax=Stephania yunnanensis TaxID=152371 RepID=A0AAP0K120_9MAGN